ncbi:hypothetical protein H5410_002627 [Solanum commersonii]|uniref:DUF4283 domain-containing protein n=1 Tax=Solanum commersonii TaxID=4109 RepID=A0A9J6B2G4_SOLCO|nr:hypothetical protein H5410_002627 [Solanum commersonii]
MVRKDLRDGTCRVFRSRPIHGGKYEPYVTFTIRTSKEDNAGSFTNRGIFSIAPSNKRFWWENVKPQIAPEQEPRNSYAGALSNKETTRAKNRVRLLPRSFELVDGRPVVIFTSEENEILAQTCKWTLVGKFSKIRPSIDIIRKDFAEIIPGKGVITIGAYDMRHVFINFDNIEDHLDVASRSYIPLRGDVIMKIKKWSTNFKPESNDTTAPIWITLPNLPWHYYKWDAIFHIAEPIGIPLVWDKATVSKTRPTMAKLRVEIDLAKPILREITVEIRDKNGFFVQKVEYDTLPAFCCHCKTQGHNDKNCRILHPELREEQRGAGDNQSMKADPSSSGRTELAKNLKKDTLPRNEKGHKIGQQRSQAITLTKSVDTQLDSYSETSTGAGGWKLFQERREM